jgi:CRISPR-associated protein Csb1
MTLQIEKWLENDGPVALTIVEALEPAGGKDAPFFPPTFAPQELSEDNAEETGTNEEENASGAKTKREDRWSYVFDEKTGTCIVDTVGSQANRLEPMFKRDDLADLVPKFTVTIGSRSVNLLDAGHRAADAAVRFSDKWNELRQAFLAYRDKGDAQPLAKIAPTSLVFGVWDSRDTGTKIPRLVESTIRAHGVTPQRRSAQYFSVVMGSRGALEEGDTARQELESLSKKARSQYGLADNPAGSAPGGMIAKEIRREAILNLVALRAIGAGQNREATHKLQRYILGLALVAFTAPVELYLRQGCLLVASENEPSKIQLVYRNGKREPIELTQKSALSYAKEAAREFVVVDEPITAVFNPMMVHDSIAQKKKKTDAKKARSAEKKKGQTAGQA